MKTVISKAGNGEVVLTILSAQTLTWGEIYRRIKQEFGNNYVEVAGNTPDGNHDEIVFSMDDYNVFSYSILGEVVDGWEMSDETRLYESIDVIGKMKGF